MCHRFLKTFKASFGAQENIKRKSDHMGFNFKWSIILTKKSIMQEQQYLTSLPNVLNTNLCVDILVLHAWLNFAAYCYAVHTE